MYEDRWSVVSWPVEYGGRDLGIFEWLVFEEEYYRVPPPKRVSQNGIFLLAPTMLEYGTDAQKARYLPPMASGDEVWCQGWSEPDAGSDLAGIRSRATRDLAGDGWVLDGQKTWASRGAFAEWCFGIFRTDPDAERHRGLTYFLIAMDAPGRHRAPHPPDRRRDAGSPRSSSTASKSPEDQVLGEVGAGWSVAMATAGSERGLSLRSPARYTEAADRLVDSSRRRGGPPASADAVARAHIAAEAYQLHTYWTASRVAHGHAVGAEASATRSGGPRPTSPSTPPRSTCSVPRPSSSQAGRPAIGSTATSSRWPGRSTPGRTRSNGTWWPSACSDCPAARPAGRARLDFAFTDSRRSSGRACAPCSTRSARRTPSGAFEVADDEGRAELAANRWAVLAELGAPALVVPEAAERPRAERDRPRRACSKRPGGPVCPSRCSRRPPSPRRRSPRGSRPGGRRRVAGAREGRRASSPSAGST